MSFGTFSSRQMHPSGALGDHSEFFSFFGVSLAFFISFSWTATVSLTNRSSISAFSRELFSASCTVNWVNVTLIAEWLIIFSRPHQNIWSWIHTCFRPIPLPCERLHFQNRPPSLYYHWFNYRYQLRVQSWFRGSDRTSKETYRSVLYQGLITVHLFVHSTLYACQWSGKCGPGRRGEAFFRYKPFRHGFKRVLTLFSQGWFSRFM